MKKLKIIFIPTVLLSLFCAACSMPAPGDAVMDPSSDHHDSGPGVATMKADAMMPPTNKTPATVTYDPDADLQDSQHAGY